MTEELLTLTSDIVIAHVSHNKVGTSELTALIHSTYAALEMIGRPVVADVPAFEPAVSIRASVKPDYLVCLEDGKKLTMLKRYLRTNYGMSPEDYRAKWGLPSDYPMVAPNYAAKRRTLALSIGLGRKKATDAVEAMVAEPIGVAVKAGRKKLGIATAKAAAPHPEPAGPKASAKPRRAAKAAKTKAG